MNGANASPSNNRITIASSNPIRDGIEHAPGGGDALLRLDGVAFLLLDHQAGLFQVVKDIGIAELRANTSMLAKLATLLKIQSSQPLRCRKGQMVHSCRKYISSPLTQCTCLAREK
jgi:hypothetical protein